MKRLTSSSKAGQGGALERDLMHPHPVDVHVGNKIRYWRNHHGITQGDLRAEIGVTFQQLQKYESGKNRVSASRLYDIALCLRVPIWEFFDGLPATDGGDGKNLTSNASIAFDYVTTVENRKLTDAYFSLKPVVAKTVLTLLQAIASSQDKA